MGAVEAVITPVNHALATGYRASIVAQNKLTTIDLHFEKVHEELSSFKLSALLLPISIAANA